ncbi:beta propeller repeat protein [Anaerosporobacter faecicola]|uniref:endoglucanase n=1 Tax=Anaerosporobacter faecicola TaxID=2718714 RepID=UPI00143ACEB6|nr:endoglucanase [Anaerosporobacter faecicola]
MNNKMETRAYTYQNIPIPGGGYVTGFLFDEKEKNVLYARTDIGGTYRFDFANRTWKSLINHVRQDDVAETYPLSFAVDNKKRGLLYIVCGYSTKNTGKLCISTNYGETFTYKNMPCKIHGNNPGRGTGERLLVDPVNSNILYFGSQSEGLMRSVDQGEHWEFLTVSSTMEKEKNEKEITFVWIDPRVSKNGRSQIIVVGTSGEGGAKCKHRGQSLYISTNGGDSFEPLKQPKSLYEENDEEGFTGYVGARYAFDGTYLYVTMSEAGQYGWSFACYSCDCGMQKRGKVIRYKLLNGIVEEYKDITPTAMDFGVKNLEDISFGMGGIATTYDTKQSTPVLICSTICYQHPGDIIFISRDQGETWTKNLQGLETGKIHFTVPYMKPEYNGGESILHWLTDLKINPFDENHAIFNSGTGAFVTYNLLSDACCWEPECRGIEETVHLNLYAPSKGDVKLIDILGDLGGFAFTDLNQPAENTFADEKNDRYITCINADYSENNQDYVVVTPRGNWTGKTKGGLIVSNDQCKTFKHLPQPYGIKPFIDELIKEIERPNVNAGWVAMSADSKTIVWSIGKVLALPVSAIVYTKDEGKTYHQCRIFDTDGECISETYQCPPIPDWKTYDEFFAYCNSHRNMKVMADRVNPDLFYGFGEASQFYVSVDGGVTFYQKKTPANFPEVILSGFDCNNHAEIRVEADKEGVIWMALGEYGLWKVQYDKETQEFVAIQITEPGNQVKCQGMGLGLHGEKAIYMSGILNGEYGFFVTEDEGKTYCKLNTEEQMFGDIMSIVGDPRVPGRFYIATGSRGVLYGTRVDEM